MDKSEVARRQLGVALDMFLRKQDPISIHTLAMAGGEIAEWLAKKAGAEPFIGHIQRTFPGMTESEIRRIQRKFSNAFKHALTKKGGDRGDDSLIESFDPDVNVHVLWHSWKDYGQSLLPLPIEAQVFDAWYFAKHVEKVSPEADISAIEKVFPNLASLSTQRQHERLLGVIRKTKKNGVVMSDPLTDRRPLVLSWAAS